MVSQSPNLPIMNDSIELPILVVEQRGREGKAFELFVPSHAEEWIPAPLTPVPL